MASVSSVNALQASVAQAERQVQQDQSRVSQDASRLEQSRAQLDKDKQTLTETQKQSRAAQQPEPKATPAVRLDQAIENPPRSQQILPPDLSAPKPQLNTQGQTIGKLINIVA
ncbi:MAG: hypothetical protein ACEQSK_11555 [Sphingomonadaceae bacterium]